MPVRGRQLTPTLLKSALRFMYDVVPLFRMVWFDTEKSRTVCCVCCCCCILVSMVWLSCATTDEVAAVVVLDELEAEDRMTMPAVDVLDNGRLL